MRTLRPALVVAICAIGLACGASPAPHAEAPRGHAAPPGAWASPTAELSVVNLYDAFGAPDPAMKKDWGFSAIVRYRGKTYLFDAGTRADVFARNLAAKHVDPREIDYAVLSHPHYDHMAGFDHLLRENPRVKLILPKDFSALGAPVVFPFKETEDVKATLPVEQRYFDGATDPSTYAVVSTGRFWNANVEYVTEAKDLEPGVAIIPTASSVNGTYFKLPDGTVRETPMPELSASFSTSKGEVVLVGCSHSGVDRIVEAARRHREAKIHLLAGGYHLVSHDRAALDALAKRLHDDLGVEGVAPAHCTGQLAFSILGRAYGPSYRFFGLGTRLDVGP